MKNIFQSFVILIVVFTFHNVHSQNSVIELTPNFVLRSGEVKNVSQSFDIIQNTSEVEFIGISAFDNLQNDEVELQYRVKSGAEWMPWEYFYHSQDNAALQRRIYESAPIYQSASKIQFASSANISSITIRLFIAEKSINQPPSDHTSLKSVCSCELPVYCDRTCWCPGDNCAPQQSPAVTQPTHVIVHHSAGFNTSTNFSNVVAYYYDLHVNTNGWDDIGYNWLVDPNGIIYEGRGSLAQGAHFSCMNGGTTGICMIGNYNDVAPTEASVISLENLIAWEMCDKGLDPNSLMIHEASELLLPTISGHRDGNNSPSSQSCASGTECPGDILYDQLPVIRTSITESECMDINTSISTTESTKIGVYPNPFTHQINIAIESEEILNISVINIYGELVIDLPWNRNNLSAQYDLSSLSEGMYSLLLITDHEIISKRIVKISR